MPKSNAFDFTNKKNTGASLGHFIAEKLEKEAKKQAAKVRKASLSSAGGSTDGHETSHGHGIDLRVPGKELGDEGFSVLAGGLTSALMASDEMTGFICLALTDLDLTSNYLTAASLTILTAVLQHAKREIRTLVLTQNHISVVTDEEAEEWEALLRAFSDCSKMKRVDFTGNPLGGRALETLARVHLSEAGKPSGGSGIRSVASIALNNVGLDDISALWLSYILEDRLMPGVEWNQDGGSLSKEGLALVRKAEALRLHLEDGCASQEGNQGLEESLTALRPHSQDRRGSLRSSSGSDPGDAQLTELDSLRKRIQRHIIMHDRATSVDLWRAALRLLHCTRMLLVLAPTTRHYHVDVENAEAGHGTSKGLYASNFPRLGNSAVADLGLAITDVTNAPITLKTAFKLHRKDAFSKGADPTPVTGKLQGHALRDLGAQRFVCWQKDYVTSSGGQRTIRDKGNVCHLPQHLVERIARYVLSPKVLELLGTRQREAVAAWGLDRKSLAKEQEWKKKDDSSQMWMLLDSVKCLEYGQ